MKPAAFMAAAACALALSGCAGLRLSPGRAPVATAPISADPAVAAPAIPAAAAPSSAPRAVAKSPARLREACVPRSLPRAPRYPDTDAALRDAGGAADRYQLMAAGRLLRERRLADLEKAVDACR